MLHAPDFLGYESGLHMADERPELLQRGLRLMKACNRLMEVIGGRSVLPINVRIGGFYRAPARSELRALTGQLEQARQDALETVRWVATFPFPDFDRQGLDWISKHRRTVRDYEHLAASHEAMILWAMIPVDCTILCRSAQELVVSGGCLNRAFKKVFVVS